MYELMQVERVIDATELKTLLAEFLRQQDLKRLLGSC